jgi:hypothetical protein
VSSEAKRSQMLRELQGVIEVFRSNGVTPREVIAALLSMVPELAWEHVGDDAGAIVATIKGRDVDMGRLLRAVDFVRDDVKRVFAYCLEEGGFQ